MKVYVACSSKQMVRAREAMDRLRGYGIEVTSQWIEHIEKVGMANPPDAANRQASARMDLADVEAADVLLLLVPPGDVSSHGAFFEAGYMHGLRKPFIAAGAWQRSIFTSMATHRFDSDSVAIGFIANQLKEQYDG